LEVSIEETGPILFDQENIIWSVKNYLIVWNTVTGQPRAICENLLIRSFDFETNQLVTTYGDILKLWNLESLECEKIYKGHDGPIIRYSYLECSPYPISVRMDLSLDKIVSGSQDFTVRIWSFESGQCLMVLRGHQGPIRCVRFDRELVVSSSDDSTVKVWRLNSGILIHTLVGHTAAVDSVAFNELIIVSGSVGDCTGMLCIFGNNLTVRVWNTQTGQHVHLRNLLGYPAYDMVLVEDKLVTTHETYFTIWNPYDFYVYQGEVHVSLIDS
jgi:WD40 repeat protein